MADSPFMNVLALEAATSRLSAALVTAWGTPQAVLASRTLEAPRAAAERLLEMVSDLSNDTGCPPGSLDLVAVDRGPGMFTGIRMALSTAQGIAAGLGLPIATVDALAALALTAAAKDPDTASSAVVPGHYLCLGDARKGELYLGAFMVPAGTVARAAPERLVEDTLVRPEGVRALLPDIGPAHWCIVGAGANVHARTLAAQLAPLAPKIRSEVTAPSAAAVAWLGARAHAEGGSGPPERALPVYLRSALG